MAFLHLLKPGEVFIVDSYELSKHVDNPSMGRLRFKEKIADGVCVSFLKLFESVPLIGFPPSLPIIASP